MKKLLFIILGALLLTSCVEKVKQEKEVVKKDTIVKMIVKDTVVKKDTVLKSK